MNKLEQLNVEVNILLVKLEELRLLQQDMLIKQHWLLNNIDLLNFDERLASSEKSI